MVNMRPAGLRAASHAGGQRRGDRGALGGGSIVRAAETVTVVLLHEAHDTQQSKPRSRWRPCDFLRACARRGVVRARQLPRCGYGVA